MPFKLAIRFAGKLLDTVDFDKDIVTIGRAPDCDVVIDNLGVSRVHAQIERTRIERNRNVYILTDLKSNNGTFVRGERIQQHNLNNGDEFFLGKHSINFLSDDDELEGDSAQEGLNKKLEAERDIQTMTMSIEQSELANLHKKQAPTALAFLTGTGASGVRQNIPITKAALFFGNDPKCDYKLEGWFINKRHVLLLREENGFRLIHLGAKRPPKINGLEVDDQKLKHGDVLEIEGLRFVFNVGTP